MKNNYLLIVASIIITFLIGCGAQPEDRYISPQQINEPTISEITPVFETQTERINNCDGANPTYLISYKTIQAQKATFEVSVGGGGLVTGTPIPSVLEVQLEAKITAALAKDYGLTIEKGHDLTLNNTSGTYIEHTITWKVTRVKGFLDVVYANDKAQVAFDKIANVELYDRTSSPLPCNGQTPTIAATNVIVTKIPQVIATATLTKMSTSEFNWTNPNKPRVNETCPLILIDGTDGKVTNSPAWIAMESGWTASEPYSSDINKLCTRRSDNTVYILVGTTTSPDDMRDTSPPFGGIRVSLEQARQMIESNPGKPVIVVPW